MTLRLWIHRVTCVDEENYFGTDNFEFELQPDNSSQGAARWPTNQPGMPFRQWQQREVGISVAFENSVVLIANETEGTQEASDDDPFCPFIFDLITPTAPSISAGINANYPAVESGASFTVKMPWPWSGAYVFQFDVVKEHSTMKLPTVPSDNAMALATVWAKNGASKPSLWAGSVVATDQDPNGGFFPVVGSKYITSEAKVELADQLAIRVSGQSPNLQSQVSLCVGPGAAKNGVPQAWPDIVVGAGRIYVMDPTFTLQAALLGLLALDNPIRYVKTFIQLFDTQVLGLEVKAKVPGYLVKQDRTTSLELLGVDSVDWMMSAAMLTIIQPEKLPPAKLPTGNNVSLLFLELVKAYDHRDAFGYPVYEVSYPLPSANSYESPTLGPSFASKLVESLYGTSRSPKLWVNSGSDTLESIRDRVNKMVDRLRTGSLFVISFAWNVTEPGPTGPRALPIKEYIYYPVLAIFRREEATMVEVNYISPGIEVCFLTMQSRQYFPLIRPYGGLWNIGAILEF